MISSLYSGQKIVLYTHDLEPITIFELSAQAIHYLRMNGAVTIPVCQPLPLEPEDWGSPGQTTKFHKVHIRMELLVWRRQEKPILVTHDEESALLLKAAFLPGQQAAINGIKRESFAKGFLMAVDGLGRSR